MCACIRNKLELFLRFGVFNATTERYLGLRVEANRAELYLGWNGMEWETTRIATPVNYSVLPNLNRFS